jgi:hypothetical protein
MVRKDGVVNCELHVLIHYAVQRQLRLLIRTLARHRPHTANYFGAHVVASSTASFSWYTSDHSIRDNRREMTETAHQGYSLPRADGQVGLQHYTKTFSDDGHN